MVSYGRMGARSGHLTSDLPLNFHPAAIRASAFLNRSRFLDQRRLEFFGFIQGGGLVAPPEFIS
ncbi:hypothetical protein CN186_30975, partial [Sinorhizobium medicae]